ncbi:ER degradation-enhancing alpha-mannosidase-like 1 [Rhizoctonia solani AG-1 IA]|uniref:ER degradation-enhancing alpha-mannosidase-like 1 n=1 Tax=Thanatephorus cucumeris (strain AG1-IA) TaxID=983506 RepID=L8X3C3_THACA|nr:ER degradation-enhancing alpha-mannosidase-like 1 [Rhizoctonia solani AG-1 IA]
MNWRQMWPHTLFIVITLYIEISYWTSKSRFGATAQPSPRKDSWTKERKLEYRWAGHALVNERPVVLIVTKREATRQLWHHGFDSYMDHAFPMDEVSRVLAYCQTHPTPHLIHLVNAQIVFSAMCAGNAYRYRYRANIGHNDVMANFSLTLVDNLDTFVTFNNYSGFEWAVRQTIDGVSFDQNVKPQVFEITIRGMGGLLSAHIFAADKEERWGFGIPWYNDELLHLAYDLGKRLLPAFRTNTGIPFARVGTAGAGSLLLEWTTLSRLTGDPEFERVARKAFFAIWNRRSDLGLLPNTINLASGVSGFDQAPMVWSQLLFAGMASTGNCWDRRSAKLILTGESEYYDVWREGYSAIMKYSRGPEGFWVSKCAHFRTAGPIADIAIDSTEMLEPARAILLLCTSTRYLRFGPAFRFSGIPETFNIATRQGVTLGYPLRPENKINSDDQNMVFTTEGHLITLSQQHLKTPSEASRYFRQKEQNFCPVYQPARNPPSLYPGESYGLIQSIRSRPDSDYGRFITGLELSVVGASDSPWWDLSGRCAVPQPEEYVSTSVYHDQASPFDFDLFDLDLDDVAARLSDLLGAPMEQTPLTPKSFDYVLSIDGMVTEADKDLSTSKVHRVEGGFMVRNITGVKARMTARMDGQGYDVTMLGHHRVLSGQKVFINDPALLELPGFSKLQEKERKLAVQLKLRVGDSDEEISLFATTALFGADPSSENSPGTFRVDAPPLHVVPSNPENLNGCSDHEALPILNGAVLVVNRGTCSFLEKLTKAKKVGAAGVIVVSDVDSLINPSLDKEEEDYAASELADVGLVVLTHRDGVKLLKSLETSLDTVVPLWVKVTRQPSLEDEITKEEEEKPRLLYINGKALINTASHTPIDRTPGCVHRDL